MGGLATASPEGSLGSEAGALQRPAWGPGGHGRARLQGQDNGSGEAGPAASGFGNLQPLPNGEELDYGRESTGTIGEDNQTHYLNY